MLDQSDWTGRIFMLSDLALVMTFKYRVEPTLKFHQCE